MICKGLLILPPWNVACTNSLQMLNSMHDKPESELIAYQRRGGCRE